MAEEKLKIEFGNKSVNEKIEKYIKENIIVVDKDGEIVQVVKEPQKGLGDARRNK